MDARTKIKIGKIAETLWLLSRGLYGRDLPDHLLKLAAIASEVLEAVRKNPNVFPATFEGIIEDFQRETRNYLESRCLKLLDEYKKTKE